MQIKYLKNKEIDRTKWDACVENSKTPLIYGLSWYLDIVAENWDGLVEGDYEAVFPVPYKKKYFLNFITQPLFLQKINIFSKKEVPGDVYQQFFKEIPSKFLFGNLKIDIDSVPPFSPFIFSPNSTFALALDKSYEYLYSAFSKGHKRNVKLALNNSVEIVCSENTENPVLMKKQVHKAKGIAVAEKNYEKLKNIIDYSVSQKQGEIYDAYYSGTLCASAFFAKSGVVFTIFSGSDSQAQKIGASFLIIAKFIEDHADSDCVLDFAGSNIKGIAEWNKGFGAKESTYLTVNKIYPLNFINRFLWK